MEEQMESVDEIDSAADVIDLRLTFKMESDWGVGTGTGRAGDLDEVIAKDPLGLPMLPAKSITGVFRDACEEAAFALDGARSDGAWNEWVSWLFGDQPAVDATHNGASIGGPRPAVLSFRPARFSQAIQDAVRPALDASHRPESEVEDGRVATARALRQAATTRRPAIAIDDSSGTTVKGSLRVVERGRRSQTLAANGTLAVPPARHDTDQRASAFAPPGQPESLDEVLAACGLPTAPGDSGELAPAAALLTCATHLLNRIGADRRRGAGKCTTTLHDTAGLAKATVPAPQPAGASDAALPATDPDATPTTHRFRLSARTPVVVGAEVKGNVVETLDFIPGYLLLPIVARSLGPAAADWIRGGTLAVSDATPTSGGGPLLPTPNSLEREKGSGESLVSPSIPAPPQTEGRIRRVPLRGGWVDPSRAVSTSGEVERVRLLERAHAVIADDPRSADDSSAGIFVQESIAAGQVFEFEVTAPAEVTVQLPSTARIGRSKKDDYGLVAIEPVTGDAIDTSDSTTLCDATEATLQVWLVSDCLLVDPDTLAPTATPEVLAAAVRVALREAGAGSGVEVSVREARTQLRRHDTWSVGWGLPRPSLMALQGGSVFELDISGADSAQGLDTALGEVQRAGLGLRRAEGFGRILIDAAALGAAPATPPRSTGTSPDESTGTSSEESTGTPSDRSSDAPGEPTTALITAPPELPSDADDDLGQLWQQAMGQWVEEACEVAALRTGDSAARHRLGLDSRAWALAQFGLLRQAVVRADATGSVSITTSGKKLGELVGLGEKMPPAEEGHASRTSRLQALCRHPGEVWGYLVEDDTTVQAFKEVTDASRWAKRARTLLLLTCLQLEASDRKQSARRHIEEGSAE